MKLEERSRDYRAFMEQYLRNVYPQFRGEPQQTLFDAM